MNATGKLNDKRTINAWALFDWANSSYALVIAVAIFPGYYSAITDDIVNFFGIELKSSALYSFSISAAYLIIAFPSERFPVYLFGFFETILNLN